MVIRGFADIVISIVLEILPFGLFGCVWLKISLGLYSGVGKSVYFARGRLCHDHYSSILSERLFLEFFPTPPISLFIPTRDILRIRQAAAHSDEYNASIPSPIHPSASPNTPRHLKKTYSITTSRQEIHIVRTLPFRLRARVNGDVKFSCFVACDTGC